jgi:hypothetical protein
MEFLLEFSCPTGASAYFLRADVSCFMKKPEGAKPDETTEEKVTGVILATYNLWVGFSGLDIRLTVSISGNLQPCVQHQSVHGAADVVGRCRYLT